MSQAKAARESVLVVAAPDRAAVLVSGKERTSWLNGMITQDIAKLASGQAAYSLLVEKKGRLQADLYVVPGPDALLLGVPAGSRDAVVATLAHHLIMEDVELTTPELSFWFAHGPRATELAASVSASFSGALDLLGWGGAMLAGPADLGARVDRAAASLGGAIADLATWEALRVERGVPRFGVELDATLYPQEASLERRAVSFQKGCYLGQEVVYMLQERGHVKRRLVTLDVDGDRAPERGAAVTTPAGEPVGDVRSSALGPLEGRPVAIAMVRWAESKPGVELRVATTPARVR